MAYDELDPALKERLCTLPAVHDIARVFARRLNKNTEELHKRFPPQEHPVVRTRPETGQRLLYVNVAFTDYIKGMERKESDELLACLYSRAAIPE